MTALARELAPAPWVVCQRCVMDTTDPDIRFDDDGVCNYCRQYDEIARKRLFSGEEGRARLQELVQRIRREGTGKPYDCVIGVSGGVDSTYVGRKVRDLGLRPLAVHLDNGWDSELAVSNITKALKKLQIDLHTHVIDWEEFKDLQIAFLLASTPDSEIPSDHAIVSLMHQTAEKIGVRFVITGYNWRTESHHSIAWSQGHYDWRYIKSVHRRFGRVRLRTFPHMDLWSYRRYLLRQEWVDLLNYLDYVKRDAIAVLERELGWRYYGGKHYESIYTRFYQGYILPRKFGYDKRKSHYSSLICSGEMSRIQALEALKEETYRRELQEEDRRYVLKKLGLTSEELERIMNLPKRTYWDYPSYGRLYRNPVFRGLRAIHKLFR